jgi:carboxymethylenebutenolidase
VVSAKSVAKKLLMKKLITLFIVITATKTFSQSCCNMPHTLGTEACATLSEDKKFIATHLEPEPFVLEMPMGKELTFKTPDGKEGYAYIIEAKKPTDKFLFVIHEWWGLNDYIKQESEKWYNTLGNVTVIAIDLYDKKVAITRDSAAKYMGSVKTERATAIIQGAISYATTAAEKVNEQPEIATVGWCFGGGWSLQASLLSGLKAKACVMYYGMPEENQEKIENLQAPVMMIWPQQDKWINKDVVTKFEATMKKGGKHLEVKPYNADHAFANPSNPKYNKEFADDAFTNASSFVKKRLK